jgi:tRNA (cmo5U34)-methyltransferase
MSQFHFDPASYLDLMREEVPDYERLQEEVAAATDGIRVTRVLDLGTGTGVTLAAVLARHPGAVAVGIDESAAMLEAARVRFGASAGSRDGGPGGVELRVADLADPLPAGPFDVVVSALAVHHLDGLGKSDLFRQVADVVDPLGRFVLGDVVVPEDPADAVTPLSNDYDRPSSVAEQLRWLHESGFDAALVWSQRDLAVLRADRRA